MLSFVIRTARPDDLDPIWALVRRAVAKMNAEGSEQWGPDYPTCADYAADISRGELWAAVDPSGRILGVACINRNEDPSYAGVCWAYTGPVMSFHRAAVDPDIQRSGVATALLRKAEELARDAGLSAIHLDTYSKNRKMQGLFRKLGFVQRGEIHLHSRSLPFPAFEKTLCATPQQILGGPEGEDK